MESHKLAEQILLRNYCIESDSKKANWTTGEVTKMKMNILHFVNFKIFLFIHSTASNTMKFRFFKPPREIKFGSRIREFKK